MKINLNRKKQPNSPPVCKRSFKRKNSCYCSIDPNFFKSRKFNHEEIFQIPGISDVSLMGTDGFSQIPTSKVLLSRLGPKFDQLLQQKIIKLDYPFEVIQAIHNFTLSGVCNFNSINLRSLLSFAKQFNIIGIKAQAGSYLVEATNIGNVLQMYQISQDLLCAHTTRKTKEFILENFEELGENENFLNCCNPLWMSEFIKDETLNASEENAFKIILQNEQATPNLARFIRFGLLDQTFFNAVVKTCPFFMNNTYVQLIERSFQNKKAQN